MKIFKWTVNVVAIVFCIPFWCSNFLSLNLLTLAHAAATTQQEPVVRDQPSSTCLENGAVCFPTIPYPISAWPPASPFVDCCSGWYYPSMPYPVPDPCERCSTITLIFPLILTIPNPNELYPCVIFTRTQIQPIQPSGPLP